MSVPTQPYAAPPARRPGDRPITIVLLVLQALSVLVFGAFGLFIAFVSDSCGASARCNTDLIGAGMVTPLVVSVVLFVVSLVHSVAFMRAHKYSWWIPLLWTVLSGGGIALGFVVALSGVSSNGSLT